MARRVTIEDIQNFNEIYAVCRNYAEVARQTGWSASTVKKYIQVDYVPQAKVELVTFDKSKIQTAVVAARPFLDLENFGELCVLSNSEKDEMQELWKELVV